MCFMDPSNFPENPGWMLRNLLVLIKQRFKINRVQILCYRDTHGTRETPHSLILNLETASHPLLAGQPQALTSQLADLTINSAQHQEREADMPKVTGWERNPQGKLAAKTVDLSLYLDPVKLAEQASDLNLKLIKWRLVPDINLDIIKSKKYLLLGAGTLGSNVARLLLGWGARKITFVDNAKVSLSNPVRQSLFTFDNARGGGVSKAQCAAEALRLVSPSVEAEGHALTVPMAGHPIMDETATRSDLEKLERLIDEHDVLFLLMDTRESRWLPTVIGRAKDKLVLNAALGFDSWLAMRHGVDDTIGCYFCNDVVAPADSLKDATLDQQCTVTRPGVAYFASAALVEICVSMLQSPMLGRAKPPGGLMGARKKGGVVEEAEARNVLGVVPHQLRGFLSNFTTMCIQGPAYSSCSACSPRILEEYRREGFDFVKKALNERGYVEELSGLAEVHRLAEAADVDFGEEEDGEGDLDEEILL